MTDEIGPFNAGPFYDQDEISMIIWRFSEEKECYLQPLTCQMITSRIIEYLDENYKREKNGI